MINGELCRQVCAGTLVVQLFDPSFGLCLLIRAKRMTADPFAVNEELGAVFATVFPDVVSVEHDNISFSKRSTSLR